MSPSTNFEDFSRIVAICSNAPFGDISLHGGKEHVEVEDPSRNKSLEAIEGSGDNMGLIGINDKKAPDNLKKKAKHRKNFRGWCNQIWKRIRNGLCSSFLKKE